MTRRTEADLFERDLFGTTARRPTARMAPRLDWTGAEAGESSIGSGALAGSTPRPQDATPPSATSVVLKRTTVRLPTLGDEFEIAKLLDTATDVPTTRATGRNGTPVDSQRRIADEERARLRRYRQIHPVLADLLTRSSERDRISVLVWLDVEEEPYDKGARQGDTRGGPPLVASREAVIEPTRRPDDPSERPPDPRMIAYRRQVDAAVEQAMRGLPQATGVRVIDRIGAVPGLVVEATPSQVARLSARSEVTGLFLYEPRGINDLTDSMRIARATPVVDAGLRGTNIRVAIWEPGPDVLTDLRIEEFYDSTQADKADHGRLTTAIIKNRQTGGPHGYAPDAKTYSANSYDLKALNWAIVSKQCRVVNQSFHRESAQTSGAMHPDDMVKDYFAIHHPWPTIVHAAGNLDDPAVTTEFVNHKGYNSVVVGNHDDAARLMRPKSVFRNPTSTHQDRELPDLCANGDNVTAAGVTHGGTSFASPAVAGSVALLQNADNTLLNWPEGSRAILLAGAGRNVVGRTWWDDVAHRVDGLDGAGALDTRASVQIARARAARNNRAARCGWNVGTLYSADFATNGRSTFVHRIAVPAGGTARHVRVGLAWSSKVTYESDSTLTPPIKNVVSRLTVDLDLHVYQGTRHVAWSSSFDNSYEVVDFQGDAGATYDIVIRRWSGTDWVWHGVAWMVF